jgi:hypothetical protein
MHESLYDPEPWQRRAEELRTAADGMGDPVARQSLLRLANDYELLAKRSEARRDARAKVKGAV